MNTPTSELISSLVKLTQQIISKAEHLLSFSQTALQQRPGKDCWNALECIEHLNRYGAFYLPEIGKRIEQSPFKPSGSFKSGIIGNYFAKTMASKKGSPKMKTFKEMDPMNALLDKQCIHIYIDQQNQMLRLLKLSGTVDLNRTKTSISITKLVTLKLGDTLRFVINHNERHMLQALAALPVAINEVPADGGR